MIKPPEPITWPKTTQGADLPEIEQISIRSISKLDKGDDFQLWKTQVCTTLDPLHIHRLVLPYPRPEKDDPTYARWKVWSVAVRSWLFSQMTNEMLDYVLVFYRHQGEKGALPRYADEMFHLINLASIATSGKLPRAIAKLWATRRAKFSSAEEYILAWVAIVELVRQLEHPISPFSAVEIMFIELKDELPGPVTKLRGVLQGSEASFDAPGFIFICNKLLTACEGNAKTIPSQPLLADNKSSGSKDKKEADTD